LTINPRSNQSHHPFHPRIPSRYIPDRSYRPAHDPPMSGQSPRLADKTLISRWKSGGVSQLRVGRVEFWRHFRGGLEGSSPPHPGAPGKDGGRETRAGASTIRSAVEDPTDRRGAAPTRGVAPQTSRAEDR
jgi:hypothetical protein